MVQRHCKAEQPLMIGGAKACLSVAACRRASGGYQDSIVCGHSVPEIM